MRKGISLTILVITMIVMVLLAGTVVVSLTKNNPLFFANEAAFKTSAGALQEDINTTIADLTLEQPKMDINKTGEISEFAKNKSLINKFSYFFTVVDGKCVVKSEITKQSKYTDKVRWAKEIGMITMMEVENTVMFSGFDGKVNRPEPVKGLIPVVYNEVDKKWHVARPGNVTEPFWYDYENQQWANAVFISDEELRNKILASDGKSINKEAIGTIIEMDKISSMWVWIPRYSYKIYQYSNDPDSILPGRIDVKFSQGIETNNEDGFNRHKGFVFDGEEREGFWYAKFNAGTGGTTETTTVAALEDAELLVKPNIYRVDKFKLSEGFEKIRKMEMSDKYGYSKEIGYNDVTGVFATENNGMDIHCSKGLEYGAVAYLTTSQYGKQGNPDYIGAEKEVYPSNDHGYTGKSTGVPSGVEERFKNYTYDVEIKGTGGSTTGNIYGIYDMAGIATFQMSTNKMMGEIRVAETGFTQFPNEKYYDIIGQDGDATTECIRWYADEPGRYDEYTFNTSKRPWRTTGYKYDYQQLYFAGIFTGLENSGGNYDQVGYRPVITVLTNNNIEED